MNKYRATGALNGYPWGVTLVIDADSIEAAHEEAEDRLDEVISVSGPLPVTLGEMAQAD